jgi:methylmalonyl-CoA mutase N-terminal domain/subunit
VLGGCQSLHCNGRDEALSLPTEEAARIALRTQQIVAAETGVANTVDPVGGAYAIESLTDSLEREALAIIEHIDRLGGTLAAIEQGWIQREVQEAAYRTQQAVDSGELVVVGVNRFREGERVRTADDGESSGTKDSTAVPDAFRLDPEIEARQAERVRALRSGRSAEAWQRGLDAVSHAARDGSNLVPPILAAVQAYATVGEIADELRGVFGQHVEAPAL